MKPQKGLLIITFFFVLFAFLAQAQDHAKASHENDTIINTEAYKWIKNSDGLKFTENKGQMADMQGKAVKDLLFKASASGVDMYITTSGLSYVCIKAERHEKVKRGHKGKIHDPDSVTGQYCRADMVLIGANIQKENIIKEDVNEGKADYYLGGICPDGILDVHSYKKITIKNIYPGIDWVLHSGTKGLKYDFIVHPGVNPSLIRLKYKWTDEPELQNDGSLKIRSPLGVISEGLPISYTENNVNKIKTSYKVENGEIGFDLSNYNTNEILIIDPTLIWATYYGGSDQDEANSIYSDGKNVCVTGWTNSNNFPVLNIGGGAYFQGTLGGNMVGVFILNFNTSGILKWATYYGGSGNMYGDGDVANSIQSDGQNIWVTGYTFSPNFPTLNPGGGAYFQGTNPDINQGCVFVLQFTTTGVRKWATYYGGSRECYGTSIFSDGKDVWVTGYAFAVDFPTFNPGGGAFYQGSLEELCRFGYGNAFILKFTTSGICEWSTYYGNCDDWGASIYSNGTNVWIAGNTSSINFPTQDPGGGAYFQGTPGSSTNNGDYIFILQFDTACVRKWATYYGDGGGGGDQANCIQSDGTSVWVTGYTESKNFPTFNPGNGAYYQDTLAATFYSSNAFILQFSNTGVRKWATYYGGSGSKFGGNSDEGLSIYSDSINVWVSGITGSTNFPTLNPGNGAYFQDSIGGTVVRRNSFILQFSTNGVRKWATYYGGAGNVNGAGDFANSINSDRKNVWVCGWAGSLNLPLLDPGGGAFFEDTTDINEDAFILQFNTCSYNSLKTSTPSTTICSGSSTTLNVSGAESYSWSPSTGLSLTNTATPIASPTVTTTYTVIGCSSVTDSVIVNVNPAPAVVACCNTTIDARQSTALSVSPILNTNTYYWTPPNGLSCTICPNPNASPLVNTVYYVTITDSIGCTKIDTVIIDVVCGNLFIPEAFSPNGDGQNDKLYVRDDCIKTMNFVVFDRWGNKVFETNDQNLPWDGTYKGKALNAGSYVYYLNATMYDGTSVTKKGNVALVR